MPDFSFLFFSINPWVRPRIWAGFSTKICFEKHNFLKSEPRTGLNVKIKCVSMKQHSTLLYDIFFILNIYNIKKEKDNRSPKMLFDEIKKCYSRKHENLRFIIIFFLIVKGAITKLNAVSSFTTTGNYTKTMLSKPWSNALHKDFSSDVFSLNFCFEIMSIMIFDPQSLHKTFPFMITVMISDNHEIKKMN